MTSEPGITGHPHSAWVGFHPLSLGLGFIPLRVSHCRCGDSGPRETPVVALHTAEVLPLGLRSVSPYALFLLSSCLGSSSFVSQMGGCPYSLMGSLAPGGFFLLKGGMKPFLFLQTKGCTSRRGQSGLTSPPNPCKQHCQELLDAQSHQVEAGMASSADRKKGYLHPFRGSCCLPK